MLRRWNYGSTDETRCMFQSLIAKIIDWDHTQILRSVSTSQEIFAI